MNSVVGVIQARTGSTRLPGKVLRPLAGHSVLDWVIRAARVSATLDDLIVATTTEPGDDAVVAECAALGVAVYRGPTDDVLSRFLGAIDGGAAGPGRIDGTSLDGGATDAAADRKGIGAVVRFTADCPLLDPALVEAAVSAWRAAPWLDYVSTALPRCVPRGMDVEVIRADTLREVGTFATDHHRTHVSSAIYTQPDRYRMLGLSFQPSAADLRVTLDTADDWALIEAVVDAFGDRPASMATLVPWLRAHPEVVAINAHVEQKPLVAG